ncbi:F-box domain-containing protein [Nemania abortiva]|nr:F-box domain-containing protein [Nemania abortiva]
MPTQRFDPQAVPGYLLNDVDENETHWLKGWIKVGPPSRPPASRLASRESSLGVLGDLPPEIIYMILDMLDISSIRCFKRVSFLGSGFVQRADSYQMLLLVAPKVILVLEKTGLLGLHSINDLYATLRIQRCAYCDDFGPFLFLLTCERCCYTCLTRVPALYTCRPCEAMKYLALTEESIRQLPALRVIPGEYSIDFDDLPEGTRLVSLKAARELAVRMHGSADNLRLELRRRHEDEHDFRTALQHENTQEYCPGISLQGRLFGMDFVKFPSVSAQGKIEHGLWCYGCVITYLRWWMKRLYNEDAHALVLKHRYRQADHSLISLAWQAHTVASFTEHINVCDGAWRIHSMYQIYDEEVLADYSVLEGRAIMYGECC